MWTTKEGAQLLRSHRLKKEKRKKNILLKTQRIKNGVGLES